jgi:phospholipid/cholesterol/gamma-HCH transport system ATP-binding protein
MVKLQMVVSNRSRRQDAQRLSAVHDQGVDPGQGLRIMDLPLLLLDEPTAGRTSARTGLCSLPGGHRIGHGLTVVMVTHDLDTLFELSTRIAVLAQQRVRSSTTCPNRWWRFRNPFIQ